MISLQHINTFILLSTVTALEAVLSIFRPAEAILRSSFYLTGAFIDIVQAIA